MKAVVFKGPGKVVIEDRPIPKIQDAGDIIVKVEKTALCGSELHVFRGHQPSATDFVMGHEFTGHVHEVGSSIKTLKVGDRVVSPFTTSCGECFYCTHGFSSRCVKSQLFGCPALDGGQAEYVRVPLADSTAVKAPSGIKDEALVLMADIFPTGMFAAKNGFQYSTPEEIKDSVVVLIGCGPVALCALCNITDYKPKHILAVDSVPSRLELAKSLGAEPWNFQTDREGLDKRVKELTEGRGADIIIEVVGLSPALRMGYELVRPWGVISSVGVHNGEIPWTGNEAYNKNVRVQMGRCPVRSVFEEALESLKRHQEKLGFMADKIMPLSEALEGYDLFDKMKSGEFRPVLLTLSTPLHLGLVSVSTTQLRLFASLDHLHNMSSEEPQPGPGQDASRVADQLDRLNIDGEGEVAPRTEEEYAESQLTLRAIVSSKEAGVIIGKAGKNVADLRDETGVRAGVSKVVQGVHDRVLSVTGSLSGIAKAYGLVAKGLLEGAPAMGMGGVIRTDGTHPIRLLISHNQMGTIIGRQGLKIKQIQDASGVRMVAQKEMLPQSTERIVEVQGSPGGIEKAIWEIGKCLIDDSERGYGTVLYNPAVRVQPGAGPVPLSNGGGAPSGGMSGRSYNRTGHGADFSDSPPAFSRRSGSDAASRPPPPTHTEDGEEMQTQNISIPSDMVGCIIGRGGSKISEIRKTSNARISIAKAPHDDTGERMFTITGSASANEKALYLLYENLEAEKMRRSQAQE
ncbi:hypothetical protein AA0119_g5536 [Alternaria tenuissima]|uniref:K Homology domain-containing protein n=1 Tax=Alternaria tenuissima TaxID=119927 RepID=A0A4Q4M8K1_9PLEO|nr:hypothetical protein AA0115_g6399 [Alternaria tenuissima]RYN45709.1 hypothetical protein AA0114_g8849 [Alternaria tenuissima]RYN58387.1 hypothetical protein AA0118_g7334 [Alternaria tenuissima]RYN98161.1 hypothetical protein AA0120_g2270 [Alternaria tenuissima]RYO01034.1 hypothetical protein AA0119_g5536 [Alternaria tenuissima]